MSEATPSDDVGFPGRLFVFEGPDGVGKTTAAKAVAAHLRGLGLAVLECSFPGHGPGTIGELVYRIHHAPAEFGLRGLTDASLQALHVAAHIDCIESTLVPSLVRGDIVILDRFWWSTWVYGLLAGVDSELLRHLIRAEDRAWRSCTPSAVFLLSRSTPIRDELGARWGQCVRTYNELALVQGERYQVVELAADRPVAEVVDHALRHVLRPRPSAPAWPSN